MRLDELPLRGRARIAAIDWTSLPSREALRLRELGFDEGVAVETLHRGPVGQDPIACRVGRMTIAIRRAIASAVMVEEVAVASPVRVRAYAGGAAVAA